jgi:S-methylmethionine-dependent homocysteine/selenocysteine methylase
VTASRWRLIEQFLANDRVMVLDGALATELERQVPALNDPLY